MKNRFLDRLAGVALVLAILASGLASAAGNPPLVKPGIERARLELQSDKPRYLPGEVVTLRLKAVNTSKESILIDESSDVRHGLLKIYVARGDGPFREYVGPRWGLEDVSNSKAVEVAPGKAYEMEATLLYNHGPETKHLSELYARPLREQRLENGYAFAEPGTYRIKAVLNDPLFTNRLESAPVQLTVEAPRGADLDVWNTLKADPDYGYFIQTGDPRAHPGSARRAGMVDTLERLSSAHPSSRYTGSIRSSLARYQQMLEERRNRAP